MKTLHDYQTGKQDYRQSQEFMPEGPSKTPLADAAFANLAKSQEDGLDEQVKSFLAENPGAPSSEVYDYRQMMADGRAPVAGDTFAFLPEEYYRKSGPSWSTTRGRRDGNWGYDVSTKKMALKDPADRVLTKAVRDIGQGFVDLASEATIPGRVAGLVGLRVGSHLADAWDAAAGDQRKLQALDTEKLMQEAIDMALADPEPVFTLPDVDLENPATAQGMAEEVISDVLTLLGDVGVGSALLKSTRVDPQRAASFVRRQWEWLKEQRGVALGELAYSQTGEGGNLSSLLVDMGVEGDLVEFLDSRETDSATEMALKNVTEGVILSGFIGMGLAAGRTIPAIMDAHRSAIRELRSSAGSKNLDGLYNRESPAKPAATGDTQ